MRRPSKYVRCVSARLIASRTFVEVIIIQTRMRLVIIIVRWSSQRPYRERTYVSRYLCSPVPMFPEPMFPGAYVPRYLCSPVPMFPGFCTLIVVISINRLQILPTPWYDSRLGLCLGFRFRVLVRVRVRVSLEFQTVFRLWLGCGLGLSLYG